FSVRCLRESDLFIYEGLAKQRFLPCENSSRRWASPQTPGIFSGITRVFKGVFGGNVELSGETEDGSAPTLGQFIWIIDDHVDFWRGGSGGRTDFVATMADGK
ncbi:MAG: hypothetical protein WBD20_03280, partial [Pirellulaceae bacterium]